MGKVIGIFFLLWLIVFLAGCTSGSSGFCDVASPIRPAKGETKTLSDALKGQLAVHNAKGERLCDWRG